MHLSTIFSNLVGVVFVNFVACLLQSQTVQGLNFFEDVDDCEVFCDENKTFIHTSCASADRPICDQYMRFNLFAIPGMSDGSVLNLLTEGHNGIRDRVANIMSVANMVKINWDAELAEMASLYFERCSPDVDDPCTKFIADDLNCVELIEYKEVEEKNYRFIAQNRFRIEADYFPKYFIETALSSWYYDKNLMRAPRYNKSIYQGSTVGILSDETNFTHLVFPLTSSFGCAIAQIDGYFQIICNYYPYYRIPDSEVIFINGTPGSSCPSFYPIPSESFVSLCCDGHEEVMDYVDIVALSTMFMPSAICLLLIVLAELLQRIDAAMQYLMLQMEK